MLLGALLKRKEAISVLEELLDKCSGLDGHYLELMPPNTPKLMSGGYQILIMATLSEEIKNRIQDIIMKYQLAYQIGSMWKTKRSVKKTDSDTIIIYRDHKEQKK